MADIPLGAITSLNELTSILYSGAKIYAAYHQNYDEYLFVALVPTGHTFNINDERILTGCTGNYLTHTDLPPITRIDLTLLGFGERTLGYIFSNYWHAWAYLLRLKEQKNGKAESAA